MVKKKFTRAKKFRFIRNQKKGMTLIELLAVVVILGILAAVAGVAVVKGFDSAKANADNASTVVIRDAAQRYIIDKKNSSDVTVTKLVSEGYLNQIPTPASDSTKKFKVAASKKMILLVPGPFQLQQMQPETRNQPKGNSCRVTFLPILSGESIWIF